MAAYPSAPAFNSITRTLEFSTKIVTGENGVEQRWPQTRGVESWTLGYTNKTLTERDAILSFFDSSKGSFAQDTSFTFDGTTYTGCYIDADSLICTENTPMRWSFSVTIRQVQRAADTGTFLDTFNVAAVQLPYTHEHRFLNVIGRTEGGRYGWNKRATPCRYWAIGGDVLTDTEADVIWDQFRLAAGRWKTFRFADPDSHTTYNTCRFVDDTLSRVYVIHDGVGEGINQIKARIQTVF